jgi:HlyD family secretion protein
MTRGSTDHVKILCMAILLCGLWRADSSLAATLLTGVVEDINAQTIEIPSLPGSWQRRVEWMATEGSEVDIGDLVVRLDPGDLIAQEEQLLSELEKSRFAAARRIDELKLELLDAESELIRTSAAVRLAELDAVIPASTIPRLDFEKYQLALETSKKAMVRAQADLLNKEAEFEDVVEETRLEVSKAESSYERIKTALEATRITATKKGFVIYGDNPFTGKKVFPGETLYSGFNVASVASREDLQLRFWLHEADLRKVRVGQTITVSAETQGSESFPAIIRWTSSQAVAKQDWGDSGYFEAYAEPVSSVPANVMPGMSVMGEPQGSGEAP